MNPLYWLVGGAVLVGLVWSSLTSASEGASPFTTAQGKRAWKDSEIGKLRVVLGAETVVPHSNTASVWVFSPAGSPGGVNALALAREIQGRGEAVTTTTNLYDAKAVRMMAAVLPADLMKLDTSLMLDGGIGVAVLPKV